MIAKCIRSEKDGRTVFYGAMIAEAVIALIWAAAGVSFYGSTSGLSSELSDFGQSGVVYNISVGTMGQIGGFLAVIGVIICPISSGDTAFRGARLILAEWTGLDQKKLRNRLIITIPLLAVGAVLTKLDFDVLWRYFSWSNQTLAVISLWVSTSYLLKKGKYRFGSLITALPALFMTFICVMYICTAKEGFRLSETLSFVIGIAAATVLAVIYFLELGKKIKEKNSLPE